MSRPEKTSHQHKTRNRTPSSERTSDGDVEYSQVFPDFTPPPDDQHMQQRLTVHFLENETTNASNEDTDDTTVLKYSASATTSSNMSSTSSSSDPNSTGRNNIWSSMTNNGRKETFSKFDEAFSDNPLQQDNNNNAHCLSKSRELLLTMKRNALHYFHTTTQYPHILIYTLIVFAVLATASLIITEGYYKINITRLREDARMEALESGNMIAEVFTKSLIPLRSLQQAVIHSQYFSKLPSLIEKRPLIAGDRSSPGIKDYRNVTGICDDISLRKGFCDIVEGINSNFAYEGKIVNYRLAPYGVMCFSDPLVNTADFVEGMELDTRGDIGWDPILSQNDDMLNMLTRIYGEDNELVVFGPDHMNGKQMFVAYLAVKFPGYSYTAFGETSSTFGFVSHYIDWSTILADNGIFAKFTMKNMHFKLTKQQHEHIEGSMHHHEVVIATNLDKEELMNHTESMTEHVDKINGELSASVEILLPNEKWLMVVALDGNPMRNITLSRIACILGALLISVLFSFVLMERQLHKLLLYKIMPSSAIKKLNKNETVVERYKVVTIFFSDIVGFTSLAGEMSPIQVMKMLNELYSEFDKIVEKHGVYKVETIGDAYMVVGGAPDSVPAPEAAQKVALFALELIEFVKHFRTSHGEKINIRAGIASGPVVAGVVGKSMPRYCFFGDTVNSASRMESTSETNRIQCMDLTYQLLQDAPSYLFHFEERNEGGKKGVALKGKGMTHTWWINGVSGLRVSNECHFKDCEKCGKNHEIVPSATSDEVIQSIALSRQEWTRIGMPDTSLVAATSHSQVLIDRIAAILQHRLSIAMEQRGQESMTSKQKHQLHLYVTEIASLYKNVKFHNFEHCVHVTTSMHKVIDTIAGSIKSGQFGNGSICQELWQNSFTHFVMVFGCLIHDVNHTGQSNKILQAKKHRISKKYPGPSAERNSIYISLDLLHERKFLALRMAIFPRINDRFSFGKAVFWAVLGTDIASPDAARTLIDRFDVVHRVRNNIDRNKDLSPLIKAYDYDADLCPLANYLKDFQRYNHIKDSDIKRHPAELVIDQNGLEHCVVVEHLMQLCDVSHLMQGWENFLKFNLRLYKELMDCHRNGSMSDPTPSWAVGQIGFFTNYVIPLAKRVEQICGSDVASLQFSTNATSNMKRWQMVGDAITLIYKVGYKSGEKESETLQKCKDYEQSC